MTPNKMKGDEILTDFKLLNEVISESGMTMCAIASKSGILRETLYNRLKGVGEFTASEIVGLSEALHLNKTQREKIFFAKKVELNDTM